MKKFFSCVVLFPVIYIAQIERVNVPKCDKVGHITQGAYDILNEKCGDYVYLFSFRDFQYSHITVGKYLEVKNLDGAYDTLFNAIIKGFDTPKEDITFDLPKYRLIITYMNSFGIKGVSFIVTDKATGVVGKSNYFTKNQMYKLFGKKK